MTVTGPHVPLTRIFMTEVSKHFLFLIHVSQVTCNGLCANIILGEAGMENEDHCPAVSPQLGHLYFLKVAWLCVLGATESEPQIQGGQVSI